MADIHAHSSDIHEHSHEGTANIRTAFVLNLTFAILEIAGGIWTNSLAILSDAVHDLGDSFSLGIAWYLEHRSQRPGDDRFSYGYRRFSLLSALITTIVLIVGSLIIFSAAVPRLFAPQHSDAGGMIVFALVGIAVNGAALLRVRTGKTLNTRVIMWHFLEDVLGWVAVLIVSISLLFSDIHILDPLLSILITCYVLYNVLRNLRKTLALFLQGVPDNFDIRAIEEAFTRIPGVLSTHHTHAWSLDGEHHVVSTHLVVPSDATKQDIVGVKCKALAVVDHLNPEHTAIEVEYEDEKCRMREVRHPSGALHPG